MSIMESAWQSLKWIEINWDGPDPLTLKLAQAQLRGGGNYSGIWRVAGLRSGQAERYGKRGVRAYLAEAMSNDANEELLEGYGAGKRSPFGLGWAHMPECLASARLKSTHRSVFIDRSRIADGAIIYCLSCVLWRQTGFAADQQDQHDNSVAFMVSLLESHHVLYEIAMLGHQRFWDRPEGRERLKPPSEGGYEFIILPLVDAMSDSDIALIESYVRGGGRAIICDGAGGGYYATGTRTEDLEVRCSSPGCGLASLKQNPGAGSVTVLNSTLDYKDPWARISSAIKGAAVSASVSGLTEKQSFNAWTHGLGPMVSAHVVNFNFSDPRGTVPRFQLTVSTQDLVAADNPVARLYSIDFPNETVGRPLPIARSADGHSWVVTVDAQAWLPPPPPPPPPATCNYTLDVPPRKGLGRQHGPNILGVTTAPTAAECAALCCKTGGCVAWRLQTGGSYGDRSHCPKGARCCVLGSGPLGGWVPSGPVPAAMNMTYGHVTPGASPQSVPMNTTTVHAIVVVASSEAELSTRAVAAEARMWLQKAVLASSSHGVRLLSKDGIALGAMPLLLQTDQELSMIQGEESRPFVDDPELKFNLTTRIAKLQLLMNVTQESIGRNEAIRRLDHLQMCHTPGSCLAAVNFVGYNASTVSGFKSVTADTLYSASARVGFVDSGDAVQDSRLAFEAKGPDALHRSGVFNAYRSIFRLDLDLSTEEAPLPSSLLLTIVSGFDDLGSPSSSAALGVYGGQPDPGACHGMPLGGHEMEAWMGLASTAVNVLVRPAGDTVGGAISAGVEQPCMLGETGRLNGYYLTRTCRINVSTAVQHSAKKLQIDLILAPQNGMTGCWSGSCGRMSFAWLVNAIVLQRPTVAMTPRQQDSLEMADAFTSHAVRDWWWVGPFDDGHGSAMTSQHAIEKSIAQTGRPPSLNASYASKNGSLVWWRAYKASDEAAAPHLPLSALLQGNRELITGSVAFAMASVHCAVAVGCSKRIQVSMSDRGRVWLLSLSGEHAPHEIIIDNLLHGLTYAEQEINVTLHAGRSVILIKTLSTFVADTLAINGSRSPGSRICPKENGLLNGTNEWGVALADV
jgi:hypothetical protein